MRAKLTIDSNFQSMIVDILTRVNGACQLFEYKNCGKIEDVFECAQSEIMSGALTLFDWIDHICADRRDIIVQLQDVTACWPGCRVSWLNVKVGY